MASLFIAYTVSHISGYIAVMCTVCFHVVVVVVLHSNKNRRFLLVKRLFCVKHLFFESISLINRNSCISRVAISQSHPFKWLTFSVLHIELSLKFTVIKSKNHGVSINGVKELKKMSEIHFLSSHFYANFIMEMAQLYSYYALVSSLTRTSQFIPVLFIVSLSRATLAPKRNTQVHFSDETKKKTTNDCSKNLCCSNCTALKSTAKTNRRSNEVPNERTLMYCHWS